MFPSVKKYVMPALALLPFQLFKAIPNMVKVCTLSNERKFAILKMADLVKESKARA